jgi:phosphatidylglycerol---prolipoprotein diacylglyceryl transferase
MIAYPHMNPVAFHIGPLDVHWYGLMYLVGFFGCWSVLSLRIKYSSIPRCLTVTALSDILFYIALGIIIGGRAGYMLFYDWDTLIARPLSLFEIWKGGMSFHGGLLGVMFAVWFYAHQHKKVFLDITDLIAPVIPLGLAAGRIGNFINGELWGRVTDVPWAMVFPNAGEMPRHPSQLYEFFLEGILLFLILWIFSGKERPRGAVSGLFLVSYGALRFCVEFFREPDIQMGYIAFGWLTKGQLLCLPMILIGIGMMMWANRKGV